MSGQCKEFLSAVTYWSLYSRVLNRAAQRQMKLTLLLRTAGFRILSWNNPCFPHNKTICDMIRLSTASGDYRISTADILLMAVILFWGEFTLFEYNGKGCLHSALSPHWRSVLTQSWLDSLAASWMDVLWQLIWVTIHLVRILLWDCLCNILLKGSMTLSSIC